MATKRTPKADIVQPQGAPQVQARLRELAKQQARVAKIGRGKHPVAARKGTTKKGK
ncbi:MAG TPA: hypothetical protein VEL31_26590 [Ktedonobacteraceae bacterium]|nr:hypothetical protein [Ktedonobacteraceae bacterium]